MNERRLKPKSLTPGSPWKEIAMRTHLLNLTGANRGNVAYRAIRWIAVDAALGASSGALFGVVFGAFGLLLGAQSWSIISVASYFSACGAAAGALVGACGAILEGDAVSEPARHTSQSTPPTDTSVPPVADIPKSELNGAGHQSSRRWLHNRLADVARRSQEPSRNPSRN
jgi:hypothetical protein